MLGNSFALNTDISTRFKDTKDKSEASNTVATIIGKVLSVVQLVGVGIAIASLAIIGMKWMYASPSGKAQIAKTAKYYVMGAIFLFAAAGILQIIKNFTDTNINN